MRRFFPRRKRTGYYMVYVPGDTDPIYRVEDIGPGEEIVEKARKQGYILAEFRPWKPGYKPPPKRKMGWSDE